MLTPEQIDALMNEPLYGWHSLTLLNDVQDFLDFSEASVEWQSRRELRSVETECDGIQLEDPLDTLRYREHRIEGVRYRFEVSLTQRVRYSALTAVITTLEWALLVLKDRTSFPVPKKPKRKNEAIHLLEVFASRAGQDLTARIKELELLIQVRNCIVHSAGRIETYEFKDDLRRRLDGHSGLKLSSTNFLGEGIEIESGYLESFIEEAKHWLSALEKAMHRQRLVR